MPVLYCDRGCPFAHRALALFTHLDVPFERHEVRVGEKPAGIERYSASGRIPLLVHGTLVLTESRVMLEYLAERYELADAYPGDLRERTLHRHAMAVADDYLAPRLLGRAAGRDERLPDVLDAVEAATATTPPIPCLLALQLAPLWNAFCAWYPNGDVTRAIEARPPLRSWLDAANALDCVARAAADPATLAEDLNRARAAGLLPNAVPALATEDAT